jgi:ketosteroid isomerase-like protein
VDLACTKGKSSRCHVHGGCAPAQHCHWELTGVIDHEGEPQPALHGILTHVLKRQNERWMIIVSQNTPMVPAQAEEALRRRGFRNR